MNKYDVGLELETENSMSIIVKKIKDNSTVLELGSSTGRLTRFLKNSKNCIVDIVEIDEEAGLLAAQFARQALLGVEKGNLNESLWAEILQTERYDYIIIADVLEHLCNPSLVLENCKKMINDDGGIIISVPNIAHNAILMNLYYGTFNYTSTGLLDDTHIKFWGLENFKELLAEHALFIHDIQTIVKNTQNTEQFQYLPPEYEELIPILKKRKAGDVYQYVIEAKKKESEVREFKYNVNPEQQINLYLDLGMGYSEEHKLSQFIRLNELNIVKFHLDRKHEIKKIRLDPVEGECCIVKRLKIFPDTIKQIKPLNGTADFSNNDEIIFLNNDPMYEIIGDFGKITELEIHIELELLSYNNVLDMLNSLNLILNQKLELNKNQYEEHLQAINCEKEKILNKSGEQEEEINLLRSKSEGQEAEIKLLKNKSEKREIEVNLLKNKSEEQTLKISMLLKDLLEQEEKIRHMQNSLKWQIKNLLRTIKQRYVGWIVIKKK